MPEPHPLTDEIIARFWPGEDPTEIRRQFDVLVTMQRAEKKDLAEQIDEIVRGSWARPVRHATRAILALFGIEEEKIDG
jgi:hypothetical protein